MSENFLRLDSDTDQVGHGDGVKRNDEAQCDNATPHEAHIWYEDSGSSDDAYGMPEYDQYRCSGVRS